jgi:hypothetical protein
MSRGEGLGDAEAGVQGVLEADARVAEDGVEVAGLGSLGVEADAGLEGGVVGDVEGGAQAGFDGGAGEGEAVVGEAGAGEQGEAFAEAQGGGEVEGGAQQGAAVLGGLLAGEPSRLAAPPGVRMLAVMARSKAVATNSVPTRRPKLRENWRLTSARPEKVSVTTEAEGVGDEEGDVVAAVGGGDEELPGAEGLAVDEVGAVEELDGLDAAVVAGVGVVGAGEEELAAVVGAEHAGRELAAGDRVVEQELVVVVAGGDGEVEAGVLGDDGGEDRVDVAATAGEDQRTLADRALGEDAGVEHVALDVAVEAVASALARGDVDDAADRVAEAAVEVAGDEVDLGEDVGVEDAGEAAEVEQLGDLVVAEEGGGVAGRGAADHQQAGAEGGAGDPREILQGLEGVALGAGELADLLGGDRSSVDLAAVVAARSDDRLVGVEDQREGVVSERELLVGGEALDVLEALVALDEHDDAQLAGGDATDGEVAGGVGDGAHGPGGGGVVAVAALADATDRLVGGGGDDEDGGVGDRDALAGGEDAAAQADRRRERGLSGAGGSMSEGTGSVELTEGPGAGMSTLRARTTSTGRPRTRPGW